jgi:hypothetical protein
MRIHIGEIPDSPDFIPDESWKALVEPTPWIMQALSLPVGLALAFAIAVLWMILTPLLQGPPPSLGTCVVALLAIVPAHESLHLVTHPRTGHSIIGFWPSRLLFYTHYHNQLACRRYLAVLLMPVAVISLLPLAACALTSSASAFLAVASVGNAFFASSDIFAVALLLAQVPPRAMLRNKGWRVPAQRQGPFHACHSIVDLGAQPVDDLNSRLLGGVRFALESLQLDPRAGRTDVLGIGVRIPRRRLGDTSRRELDQPLQRFVRRSALDRPQQPLPNVIRAAGRAAGAHPVLPEAPVFRFKGHRARRSPRRTPKADLAKPGFFFSPDIYQALRTTQHRWLRPNKSPNTKSSCSFNALWRFILYWTKEFRR